MTRVTTANRARLLRRAVTLTAESDVVALEEIFGDDVMIWTPGQMLWSHFEIAEELRRRDQTFTDITVDIHSLDVVRDHGYVEWVATASHTSALIVDEDTVVEATGAPLIVHGLTIAEFEADRIIVMRQYWDEAAFLTGLCLIPPE